MAQFEDSSDDITTSAPNDLADFGHFYDLNAESVLRYFYRRTACPETAADLTAETFAAALRSISTYEPRKGPTRAWLFGIARNQLTHLLRWRRIDSRARERLGMRRPMDIDDESRERIEELVDMRGVTDRLGDAMNRLSPRLVEAVELRVGSELPFAEVAKRLGCSESAARARVSRALNQLAEELENQS